MKKTFTLFIATLLTAVTFAYGGSSKISISVNAGSTMRVTIDAARYQAGSNAITISNISAGYHAVKVYQLKKNRRSYGGDVYNYQVVYTGRVLVKPQYHLDVTINRFGKAYIDEQSLNAGYNNEEEWDDENWDDNNWNNNNNNNNSNNNDYNTSRPMNAQSFSRFKESLTNESFESTRMNIAKQVIGTNYFTTSQVTELIPLFSFEDNKLELAKYAYKYTTDKRAYYSVADSFSFSNSKEELMRYIQNYR